MVTVIKGDRLIDGTGNAPLADPSLVISEGKIVGVFQGNPPDGAVPADAEILEYRGSTLLPGLIDCHVHLTFPGNGTLLEEFGKEPDTVLAISAAFAAQQALASGITTVRDNGARGTTTFDLRRALALGLGQGPRLLVCGQPITITGGHAWPLGGEADGEDGVRAKVREMAKLGADWIKVMGTGGGTVNTMSSLPSFRPEEVAALVDEAHRLSREVTVHCLSADAIVLAIDAGADQIEHASFFVDESGHQGYDPAVAAKMAESGIAVTATLAVRACTVKRMLGQSGRSPAEEAALERWSRMFEDGLKQFGRLYDAGVKFVAGSDAGWMFTPFDAVLEEIALMNEGGVPAMEAIVAATGRSAAVLGIDGQVGTITEGLDADIIAVAGNPLDDLRALRDIRLVMQGGTPRVTGGQLVSPGR